MKHPYNPKQVNHTVQYIVRTCNEEAIRTSYGQTTTTVSPKADGSQGDERYVIEACVHQGTTTA
jgi:hypothetical protein